MRRTVQNALDSRLPMTLNIKATDSRCYDYINSFTERMLARGHWVGTTPKYTISVTDQLFTLPPQFATIEQIAVAQAPRTLRSPWYEFADFGVGVVNDPTSTNPNSCGPQQVMLRGRFPSFKDITSGHRARLQCDVAADVSVMVLVLGYDANGNWVRTSQGGTLKDGELVTLAQSPGTLTSTSWGRITDIQKPVTSGQIWLYDWDGSVNTQIGRYEYWETAPNYARYLIPMVPAGTSTQIDLIGKLDFRPVRTATDYLIISNLEALRLGCRAIKYEEEGMYDKSALLMNGRRDPRTKEVLVEGAKTILEDELQHYNGDGTKIVLTIDNAFGHAGVEALV